MFQALVQLPLFDADCFGQALSAQPTRIDVLYTGPARYHVSTRHANRVFFLVLTFHAFVFFLYIQNKVE